MTWNAQGITKKALELEAFVIKNKIDILLIQESKINNKSPPKIRNYKFLNKPNKTQRGLIIYYKKHLNGQEIIFNANTFEVLGIKINNIHIFNIHVYHKVKIDTNEFDVLLKSNKYAILAGDFNANHTSWLCTTTNHNGKTIYDFLTNNNYCLFHPNGDTHIPDNKKTPSIKDFTISNKIMVQSINVINDLDSDHLPVIFTLNTKVKSLDPPTLIKNLTDWKNFKNKMNAKTHITPEIITANEIDSAIKNLTELTQNSVKSTTTKLTINNNKLNLPKDTTDLIRLRNKMRKLFQKTRDMKIHADVKNLSKLITTKINDHKNTMWANKIKKINTKPQSIWQFASAVKKRSKDNRIYKLRGSNGFVFDEKEKAEVIADQYYKNHCLTEHLSDNDTVNLVQNSITTLNGLQPTIHPTQLTSHREINDIINKLHKTKAPGHDQITNLALKHLPKKTIVQLMYIFNACLKNCYFPDAWKHAIILPFPKPGKNKFDPANYRPISLLSSFSKIFEKILLNRITKFEKDNKTIIPEQFGFRTKHSTSLQLARIADLATINFNININTALLTLDIEKAFDTVWHDALIHKLIKFKLPIYLIKLVQSFLNNRSFSVKINQQTTSSIKPIPAGVPQGAIISPHLFNYFINDIPKNNNTKLALFADDTALIATSFQKTQANKYLQRHINQLEIYYRKWKIKINSDKTKLIYLSKKKDKPKQPITFYNNIIQTEKQCVYLGVTLDTKLTYNNHIKKITGKAHGAIRELYPILAKSSPLDIKLKILIYKMYIRPIMLYACPIFSNTAESNYLKIQRVQNRALRLILDRPRTTKVTELHSNTGLCPLKDQILKLTNKFFAFNCKNINLTKDIAKYNKNNAPFRIKSKLIHDAICAHK